jgi:microcystin-dependent protein
MADPYSSTIGQIMLFTGNFVPEGWLLCNGAQLPVERFTALYAVIGTTYGYSAREDDSITHFAIPNLQGKIPVGVGQGPGLEQVEWGLNHNNFFSSHGTSTKGTLGLMYCICWEGNFPLRE